MVCMNDETVNAGRKESENSPVRGMKVSLSNTMKIKHNETRPEAIGGYVYAYTNSIIANDNFKCRGMVREDKLDFWSKHYTTEAGASTKVATVVVYTRYYNGDQMTVEQAGTIDRVHVYNVALDAK
jgi:hypothetical protein